MRERETERERHRQRERNCVTYLKSMLDDANMTHEHRTFGID